MKRNIVIATVAAAAVVCGGTAVAFADGAGTGGSAGGRCGTAEASDAKVTAVEAIDAALSAQPGTTVSADLDLDDEGEGEGSEDRGWEVGILGKGTTSYTVQVDATTGKVLGKETEKDDDEDARRALRGASVDARQAAEAATAKGFVTSVDLGDDGRSPGWDVETASGAWRVDPTTGKLTADRGEGADTKEDAADARDDGQDDGQDDARDDGAGTRQGAQDDGRDTPDDSHVTRDDA
ncbi:PepSY domain-containing protein [Streptomyces sp. NPDC053755]|uniref:PepSY domain-containing protein n=1 Tax=Streptomyces sp. NPDC053755 TaxID=3155815 RepID=UPI003418AC83